MKEWRGVVGWEGFYEVSSEGRIRNRKGRILKAPINKTGYRYFRAYRGDGFKSCKNIKVNVVVARAFLGEPSEREICDHRDRNKVNNRVGNLRYVTKSENVINCDKTEFASLVSDARGTPRLIAAWRVGLKRRGKKIMFGSYQSREYAGWVAEFVKKHATLFFE